MEVKSDSGPACLKYVVELADIDLCEDVKERYTSQCTFELPSVFYGLVGSCSVLHCDQKWVKHAAKDANDLRHYEGINWIVVYLHLSEC